jgi:arylsulfatase A-like enzyme
LSETENPLKLLREEGTTTSRRHSIVKPLLAILGIASVLLPAWQGPLSSAAEPPNPSGRPPNIVFIYADDMGWGDIACHGTSWLKTPHLDRLAREGVDFHQFNVLSPVCSPSRVAAMTGHFPSRYCINTAIGSPEANRKQDLADWLDPQAPTLPRFLKTAGYRTAHVGKWHMGGGDLPGAPAMEAYGIDESIVYHGPGPQLAKRQVADSAVGFIENLQTKQPFFLNVWIPQTHLALQPSQASMEQFQDLDPRRQVYAATVFDADQTVGRVLEALRTTGVEHNTIVLFSSDNGPAGVEWQPDARPPRPEDGTMNKGFGMYYSVGSTGGLRGRKAHLYEGGVRTPFIVRWPGNAPPGTINDTTVFTAVDLLPTLCAAAGMTLPAEYRGDGENLLPAWKGEPIRRTTPVFWHVRAGAKNPRSQQWASFAMRDGDWKVYVSGDGSRTELHDLATDRGESKDVSREHPGIVNRMNAAIEAWKATLPDKPDPAWVTQAVPGKQQSAR